MSTTSAPMREGRALPWILGLILALMLIAALILPPIRMVDRLASGGMTRAQANTDSGISDPDGTQVAFPRDGAAGDFRSRLDSVPRQDFLEGRAGEELKVAADAINQGSYLDPKSPYYGIEIRGTRPLISVIDAPIPNDSLPYQTLDLYEWTGDAWRFIPSRIIAEEERILAELNYVPASFMVMQTLRQPPTGVADVPAEQGVPNEGRDALTGAASAGFQLNGDGSISGGIAAAAGAGGSYMVAPTIRNWGDDGVVRTDLLDNLLISEQIQEAHLNAIETLVTANNYAGIDIDYRGLDPTLSAEFTGFVSKLADRMHNLGRTVSVRVEPPKQVAEDRWVTGGYDWRALGQVVDTVRVPALIDPQAYVPMGQMDSLLSWAVSEVPRDKIEVVLPAQSIEQAGEYLLLKSYSEALQPLLGEGRTEAPVLVPGEPVDLSLFNDRVIDPLTFEEDTGMFSYSYRDDAGYLRRVWLENAASIARKLQFVSTYNLKGAVLQHMLGGDYDPDIWNVVREYLAGQTPARQSSYNVIWTITSPDGRVINEARPLDASGFSFVPPAVEGEVQISASIADNGKKLASAPEFALPLATATPEVPPTPTPSPTPEATPTPSFASVTLQQTVNLRSGPGTAFGTVGQANGGDSYRIVGKNDDASWWQIELPSGELAWIIARLVGTQGDLGQVEVAADIPEAPQAVAAAAPAEPAAQAAATGGASAPPPAPKPAGGGSFGYGIQVNPYDNAFLAGKVQGMGFNWVKWQVPWKDLEGSPGAIGWGGLDSNVATYAGAGLNILLSVPKAPAWARPPGADLSVEGPPADPNTFAKFLGDMAGRYCGQVNAIEVWNEQNLHYEWGNQPLSPAGYMEMLKPAYRAIKAACPTTYVISGALTPTGAPAPWAMDDFTYLEGMYQNGLKDYADGIGAHPSGYNVPPSVRHEDACATIQRTGNSFNGPCDAPHHSWSFRSTMEGYRAIMQKYGDGNKRIWPTEFGWAAGGAFDDRYKYANDNSYEEQAAWTVESYQMMKNWGFVGPALLWNLNFRMTNNGTELAQWGILDPSGGPLPVYNALAAMPK